MLRSILLITTTLAGCGTIVQAQSVRPNPGFTMQGPAEQTGGMVKDALGRSCVDIEAASRGGVINPDMLDHVVSLKNNCAKVIKAKVCYFNSDRCRDVVLEPYKRVDTILGTMKGIKFFRYIVTTK